jgi:carbohydrate esterase-like sialic acid-specific acetylesterase
MRKNLPARIHRLTAGLALLTASWLGPESFAQSPDFHIYLGFGQSNMEGGPQVSGLAAANPRFQVLSNMNCPSLNPPRIMGKWYTANPPLTRCSAGPGIVDWFGRTLADSLPANIKIGVIMVTVVGTKIELFDKEGYQAYLADSKTEDWLRNLAKDYGSSPYARLIEMAKIAQKDGVIRGILLHQGESNVGDDQWPAKVKKIYGDIMKDLSLDPKNVPLLAGEVVNADMQGSAAGANIQIAKLPGALPNSYVISSSKLPAGGDNLHFTAEAHKTFGKRYASAMLSILGNTTAARPGDRPRPGYALGADRMEARHSGAEVDFEIPERTFVSLKAYSLGGREIGELAGKEYSAGRHTLGFDRRALPRGLCVLGMKAGPFSATRLFAAGD